MITGAYITNRLHILLTLATVSSIAVNIKIKRIVKLYISYFDIPSSEMT